MVSRTTIGTTTGRRVDHGLPARAQDWPTRPIRILVGFGAGGGTDLAARIVAQPLQEILGQPVVVENRVGAGGNIAADMLAKSPADGHTLLVADSGVVTSAPHLYRSMPFDPLRDLMPVSLAVVVPMDKLYIVGNFKETQLGHLVAGEKVRITVDAIDGQTFEGTVSSLAPASFSPPPPS